MVQPFAILDKLGPGQHLAATCLGCSRAEIVFIEGAGHLFEEPGALDQVIALAGGWLAERLAVQTSP